MGIGNPHSGLLHRHTYSAGRLENERGLIAKTAGVTGKYHQPIIGVYLQTDEITRMVVGIDHQEYRGLSFPVRKKHLRRRCIDVHDGSKGERAGISRGV